MMRQPQTQDARPTRFTGEWKKMSVVDLASVNPESLSHRTDPRFRFKYVSLERVVDGRITYWSHETFESAPSRARRILRRDDVLMSTVRPNLMAHALYREHSQNAVCSTGFAVLRCRPQLCDPGFLYLQLFSDAVFQQVEALTTGSNYPALSSHDVHQIEVPCPPTVSEQVEISGVLSDVDGLLGSLDALIAKKRAIKHATMQQLLTGRTRLPGFTAPWTVRRIRDLLRYERPDPYIVRSAEYTDIGDTPVLTANKSFILGYTNETDGICHDIPAIVFDDFTTDSKYATVPFKVKSSAIKLLRAKDSRINLAYVFHRMRFVHFDATEHKRHYISEYQNIQLPFPALAEQEAIASVLSDMDFEITGLERRRDKALAIKQGMMSALLTGRVRLPKVA